MGNSSSELYQKIQNFSDLDLQKFLEEDEILLNPKPPSLSSILESQKSSSSSLLFPNPANPEALSSSSEELKLCFSCSKSSRLQEKYKNLLQSLQNEQNFNLLSVSDPSFEIPLKIFSYSLSKQKSLLNSEERYRRNLEKLQKKRLKRQNQDDFQPLSRFTETGVDFCIRAVIDMIELVSGVDSEVFFKVLANLNQILSDLPLTALSSFPSSSSQRLEGQSLTSNLRKLDEFLHNLEAKAPCSALLSLFYLSLSSGNLGRTLWVANELISEKSLLNHSDLASFKTICSKLKSFKVKSFGSRVQLSWSHERSAGDVILTNQALTVARNENSGWGSIVTQQSLKSGFHYYELKIDKRSNSSCLIGLAGVSFASFNKKSCISQCFTVHADGDVFINEASAGKVFKFVEGDRVGMFIDMEDKSLTFYLNGVKQAKPPFYPLPEEVTLIACFGTSGHMVTIVNEPDLPHDLKTTLGPLAKLFMKPAQGADVSEVLENEEKTLNQKDGLKNLEGSLVPLDSDRILNHPDLNAETLTQKEVSVVILAALDQLACDYFKIFDLNSFTKTFRTSLEIPSYHPLVVEINETVLKALLNLLESAFKNFYQNWLDIDFNLSVWTSLCALRILKTHFFVIDYLKIDAKYFGLDSDLGKSCCDLLQKMFNLNVKDSMNPTQSQLDALKEIKNQASLAFYYGFELFYSSSQLKLKFLQERLQFYSKNIENQDVYKVIVLDQLQPVQFSFICNEDSSDFEEKFTLISETVLNVFKVFLETGHLPFHSELFLIALNTIQTTILSKSNRNDFKGIWKNILVKYSLNLLNSLEVVFSSITTENFYRISKNPAFACFVIFIYNLAFAKPKLMEISKILEYLISLISSMTQTEFADYKGQHICIEEFFTPHPFSGKIAEKVVKTKVHSKFEIEFHENFSISDKNSLKLWNLTDKKTLVGTFTSKNFPKKLNLLSSHLLFEYLCEDSSIETWGWEIKIKYTSFDHESLKSYKDLLLSIVFLSIFYSKLLVSLDFHSESAEISKFFANPLIKFTLPSNIRTSLSQSCETEELLSLSQLAFSRNDDLELFEDFSSERNPAKSLDFSFSSQSQSIQTFIQSFTEVRTSDFQNLLLARWTSDDEKIKETWTWLKSESVPSGSNFGIGGNDLEIFEKTVFVTFSVIFGFSDSLNHLQAKPELALALKQLVKQACNIRVWAQHFKQNLTDEGKEKNYAEISEEVLKKSLVFIAAGKIDLETQDFWSFREKIRNFFGSDEKDEKSGDRKIDLAKALEKVGKSVQSIGFGGSEEKNDLKVIQTVYKCLVDLYSSEISADEIMEAINSRRKLAMARVVGLELFLKFLSRFSVTKDETAIWTVRFLSESFRCQTQDCKRHYLSYLEGIEMSLQDHLKISMFSIQKQLFSLLTSPQASSLSTLQTFFYLSIMESLVFPLKIQDISKLSSLNLYEYLSTLLSISQGKVLRFSQGGKLDLSKIITGLEILSENPKSSNFETIPLTSDQSGCLSLDFFESEKLSLRVIRGGANEFDPISEIITGNECPEGYEQIPGSINGSGSELFIFVKRTVLAPGRKYLSSLRVLEEDPVVFKCFFVAYDEMVVKENNATENDEKVLNELIRKMSWVLFKYLCYSVTQNSLLNNRSSEKAQKILVNVLLDAVKSFEFQNLCKKSSNLQENPTVLMDACSGEKWINQTFNSLSFNQNPMKIWVQEFKRLFVKENQDQLLYELIQDFIIDLDPWMSGVVDLEVTEGFEDWLNDDGKIDFFVFLNSTLRKNYEDISPDLLAHPFMKIVPKDMKEAEFLLSEEAEKLVSNLLKYGNFSSSQSFSFYLNRFLESGELQQALLPEKTPKDFLNESGEFDIITSVKSILASPSNFSIFYSEIEPFSCFLRQMKGFQGKDLKPEETFASIQSFTESILWVLIQSLPAPCLKKSLSQGIELFVRLSLFTSDFLSQFSFKVLSEVLPSNHSPQTFKVIWQKIDFSSLNVSLDYSDWIQTFFILIALPDLHAARKDFSRTSGLANDMSLGSRLSRLSFECCQLLGSLCSVQRWKNFIMTRLCFVLSDTQSLEEMIGGLRFLSRCLGTNDLLECSIFEWAKIKQTGSVPAGIVALLDHENNSATLYNEETDSFLETTLDKLENIEPPYVLDTSASLNETIKQRIIQKLVILATTQELRVWIQRSGFSSVSIVENIFCSLVFRVITGLVQDLSDFKGIEHQLAMFLVKNTKHVKTKSSQESAFRVQEILKVLDSRILEKNDETKKNGEKFEVKIKTKSKQISQADETRLTAQMNENLQIAVATLQSLNFSFTDIYAAIQLGIEGPDEIMAWIASQEEHLKEPPESRLERDQNLIYKLDKKHSKFSIKDPCCLGQFEVSEKGQMSIQTSFPLKQAVFIYQRLTSAPLTEIISNNLEIFMKISLLENLLSGLFFIIFGKLKIRIDSRYEDCSVYANGDYIGSLEKRKDFVFKISVQGLAFDDLFIQVKDSLIFFNLTDSSVFDGLTFAKFGIGLAEGAGIVLNDLEIRACNEASDVDEWLSTADPFIPPTIDRFCFKVESQDVVNQARLKLFGVSDDDLRTINTAQDFQTVLKETLSKSSSSFENQVNVNYFPITDLQLFDSPDEIPEGFSVVRTVFQDSSKSQGMKSDEDLLKPLQGSRYLCIKQRKTSSPSEKYLVGLSLLENFANSSGVYLGNFWLCKESEKSCKVWIHKMARSKLAGILPLSDVFILEAGNGELNHLPLGYEIVEHAGKPVNLTPGSGTFYLCYSRLAFLVQSPLVPLVFSKRSVAEKAMNEFIEPPKTGRRSKKLIKAVKDYPSQPSVELLAEIRSIFKINKHLSMTFLLKKLVKASPEVFSLIFQRSLRSFRKLFKIFLEDLEFLSVSVQKVLLQDSKQGKSRLFNYFLEMMTSLSFPSTQNPDQDELFFELKLEGKNDEEISIPGADGLRIEFTEVRVEKTSVLRFFRHRNQVGLLQKSKKGKISDFQVPGDKLFMHFEANSAGQKSLKFKVVPLKFPGLPKVMLPDHTSVLQARWFLKCLLKNVSEISGFVTLPLIRAGLTSFFHNTSDEDLRIDLLQLLEHSMILSPTSFRPLNSFVHHELSQIHQDDKRNCQITTLQQKLISFSCVTLQSWPDKPDLIIEKWLVETHNFYKSMFGLVHKGRFQDAQRVFQYLNMKQIPKVKIRESFHPYSQKLLKQQIKIAGASLLEIEFDSRCALDAEDAMSFSYDEDGLNVIQPANERENQEAFWSSKFKWTDIVFSNNNLSVTRTNSSGWGSALWSEVYSKGNIKLSFKIDNDGKSDYLYIGVLKADGNYKLNEVINSDNSHELWTWKITGEFHRKGSRQTLPEGKFRTGDVVSLVLNFSDLSMTCLKNSSEVFKFLPISKEVIPIISFGGNNQHVTALPVENLGNDQESLIYKKLLVQGNSFYFHFPVSSGLANVNHLTWKHNFEKTVSLSADLKIAKSLPGLDEKGLLLSIGSPFKAGKHFCQVAGKSMISSNSMIFAIVSEKDAKNDRFDLISYESTGKLCIQGTELQVQGFGDMEKISLFFDCDSGDLAVFHATQQLVFSKVQVDHHSYYFACKFQSPGQLAKIIKNPEVPPVLASYFRPSWSSGNQGSNWGYKFSVIPYFWGSSVCQLIESLSSCYKEDYSKFLETYKSSVPSQVEELLVDFLDEHCQKSKNDPLLFSFLKPLTQDDFHSFPALSSIPSPTLEALLKYLQSFNRSLEKYLPLVSLSLSDLSEGFSEPLKPASSPDSLQRLVFASRGSIFYSVKSSYLTSALNSSASEGKVEVPIDRTKALKLKSSGKTDSQAMVSVFGQVFRVLSQVPNSQLRSNERSFKVLFRGEGAVDLGGPYNETLSCMCDELMSKTLNLFIPTPNHVHNTGENRESWTINPSASSKLALDMFEFLGKLIGFAIRTNINLNLTLPPLFWKRLLMQKTCLNDLKGVDECCWQMIKDLKNMQKDEKTGKNSEELGKIDHLYFEVHDSSGKLVELQENGRILKVELENLQKFIKLLKRLRLGEAELQFRSIRKGLSAIVPFDMLCLFTGKQAEDLVCGTADFDVNQLRKVTEYQGFDAEGPVIQAFWQVLTEMTAKDKSLFLRFVSGRSRLPVSQDYRKFKIFLLKKSGNPDQYLPVAHTCFFQIDLPAYSSKEILKDKIFYAIRHCRIIDLDALAGGGWGD